MSNPAATENELRALLRSSELRAGVRYLAETDSTNRWAMDEGAAGAEAPCWYVAGSQTAGKGRLGRSWSSPPGRNLYASCLLRPNLAPHQAPQVSLAAALAAHQALGVFAPCAIKWPNDVWIGEKKVAGILSEMSASNDRLEFIVVGIGINVETRTDDFPPELRQTATSLYLEGSSARPADVFLRLAGALQSHIESLESGGFAALREAWNAASLLNGKAVTVAFGNDQRTGTVDGLDDDGYLLLRTPAGIEKIVAGDVTVKK